MVGVHLTFKETANLFSKDIPKPPLTLTILPSLQHCLRVLGIPHPPRHLVFCFLNFSHSNCCVVTSQCGFSLYFPFNWWRWSSLHVLIWHSCVFFDAVSVKIFCPFEGEIIFLLLSFRSSLFQIWFLYQIYDLKILLSDCSWSFHSFNGLQRSEVLNLGKVQAFSFLFSRKFFQWHI